MVYAPSCYVVKECTSTCRALSGSSLEVNCCTTSLCNNALGVYYSYSWKNRFILTVFSNLSMRFLYNSIKKIF